MSLFFGGGKKAEKPQYTGIQLQTSTSALPVGEYWGTNRGSPNIIWTADFTSHKKQEQSGGKGASSSYTYTYSASVILGLCKGVISGTGTVYRDKDVLGSAEQIGFSVFYGEETQGVWGYLTASHPDQASSYPGLAYVAAPNYDLGDSASLSNHSFEINARRSGSAVTVTGGDARVDQVVNDVLLLPSCGNVDPDFVGDGLLPTSAAATTGDATIGSYLMAMGVGFSPFLVDQDSIANILAKWMRLFNCSAVWTGYSINFFSYSDTELTANGFHYLPNTASVYTIGDHELVKSSDENPILIDRAAPEDAKNSLRLIFKDRTNQYNQAPADWKDQSLIDQYTERPGDNITASEICDAKVAGISVSLIGQREAYHRNNIKFTLPPEYILLEPGDRITLIDPSQDPFQVRITETKEQDNGDIECQSEETFARVATQATGHYTPNPISSSGINTAVVAAPVNSPTIFQPPNSLAPGQLWIAASGGDGTHFDPMWGGSVVFVSSDGVSYRSIGTIRGASRQGVATGALASYSGALPDTSDTLSVSMLMSGDQLVSVSDTDAAAGVSLCRLGTGEFLSYETATLTSPYHYDLTKLFRGLYGTGAPAAPSGTSFVAIDQFVFKYTLPIEYVGVPLFFKFQSFNIWGSGYQDLADCAEYQYTPGIGVIAPVTALSATVTADHGVVADWYPSPDADSYLFEIISE